MAYKGSIVIPTTHDKADKVITDIKGKMAFTFGGYSRYDGAGGWETESGDIQTEDHVKLVVTTAEWERKRFKRYLQTEALYVKDELDQEAVLIEITETDMELV